MNRPPNGYGGPGGSAAATIPLSGRELPEDLVSNVANTTMGQLFYILGHIQKLSAQAPVTAQALLAENPKICYALLHAECLAGMVDEPFLPMSAEELQRAKEKARCMQEELDEHELPAPQQAYGKAMGSSAKAPAASAKYGGAPLALLQAGAMSAQSKVPPPPPPHGVRAGPYGHAPPAAFGAAVAQAPPAAGAATAEADADSQKTHLMQRLMLLTPEQIARLPEGTKMQLLQFLQQNASPGA